MLIIKLDSTQGAYAKQIQDVTVALSKFTLAFQAERDPDSRSATTSPARTPRTLSSVSLSPWVCSSMPWTYTLGPVVLSELWVGSKRYAREIFSSWKAGNFGWEKIVESGDVGGVLDRELCNDETGLSAGVSVESSTRCGASWTWVMSACRPKCLPSSVYLRRLIQPDRS